MRNRHIRVTGLLVAAVAAATLSTVGTASADSTNVINDEEGFYRYVYADTVNVAVGASTPPIHLLTHCTGPEPTTCETEDIEAQHVPGQHLWYRLSLLADRDPGAYLDANHGCAAGQSGVRITFTGTTTETDVIFLVEDMTKDVADKAREVARVGDTLTPKSITDQGVSLCIDGLA